MTNKNKKKKKRKGDLPEGKSRGQREKEYDIRTTIKKPREKKENEYVAVGSLGSRIKMDRWQTRTLETDSEQKPIVVCVGHLETQGQKAIFQDESGSE